MTIKAKEVLKNKFWLVEDDGEKIGTLSYDNEKYMLNDSHGQCHYFNTQNAISKNLGKLKYSVPEFIKTSELNKFIISINDAEKKDGGEGAIIIRLKNL